MKHSISANELSEKKECGVWGISEGAIYIQKLREASEKQNMEEFCNICKEAYGLDIAIRTYVFANVPAILLNNYFNIIFSSKEYNDFTKDVKYWESKAKELKEFIDRKQWKQFQELVKNIVSENS